MNQKSPKWVAKPTKKAYYWRLKKGEQPTIVQCMSAVGEGYLYLEIEKPELPTAKDWKQLKD